SWRWNFGDGNTSTDRNPVHTYSRSGSYTVSLTVNNSGNISTETRSRYIAVSG
ncbi:MAG: PKD domain-containing protein, partial [Methanosarcina thermophila]|nr:PKD domain-containing protein [Methanosarcina thermophila]